MRIKSSIKTQIILVNVGSSPTLRTTTEPTGFDVSVEEYEEYLRKKRNRQGYLLSDSTIRSKLIIFKTLKRRVNLCDINEVDDFIYKSECARGTYG